MSLDRFKTAQASRESGISTALCELRSGAKVSHWIWYVFPQLAGLGKSEKAIFYGLADFDEARDYLRDELLRSRLVAVTAEAAARLREGVPLLTLMGSEGDCVKLSSCLTLFDLAAADLAVDPALAAELMQLRADASEVLAATAAHGVPRCAYTLAQARLGYSGRFPVATPRLSAATHQPMRSLFHLAYHVTDLDAARRFYGGILGCAEGRSTATWVDFDFFGHQISLHLGQPFATTRTGKVGDHLVMMPHLGVVLPLDDWFALAARLEQGGIAFDIPPVVRFEGEPGEQRTMFFFDPSGNPIEVKGFKDFASVFAK